MLIQNVALPQEEGRYDIAIENGVFTAIAPAGTLEAAGEVIDGTGAIAYPPFVEPHIHLDTTLTAGEPRWNESGTLFEGIACWSERKNS